MEQIIRAKDEERRVMVIVAMVVVVVLVFRPQVGSLNQMLLAV